MTHAIQKIAVVVITLAALHGQAFAAPTDTTKTAQTPQTAVTQSTTTTSKTPAVAVPPANTKTEPAAVNKPPTLETQFANLSKLSKTQTTRLNELEIANRDALTQNQTLQLENDNLSVQVKVLQSDRGAQMFIYGAVAILVGAVIGYIIANQLRGNRRW